MILYTISMYLKSSKKYTGFLSSFTVDSINE